MKKFLHSLLVLFMGINIASFAQQKEAAEVTPWDGSDMAIEMRRGDTLTFAYTAAQQGTLYIYADNQNANDNVPVSIWGGWYHDGAYDSDSPLQEAGPYDNGVGVYGWIRVWDTDVVRFTLSAPEDAEGKVTTFTLKSKLFTGNTGSSWDNPIKLTKDTKVELPPFTNSLELLDEQYATCCSFTAPSDGVASIYTSEYLIYYIKAEELDGEHPLQYASQNESTNDHEFVVESGKEYLVFVPSRRPTEVTFKMTKDRLGLSPEFPIVIEQFPATPDLVKGNNYYKFSHELIGETTMLEVAVAEGWDGTITYMDATNWGAEESSELTKNTVSGSAATFCKNVDVRYLFGDAVVVNFNVTSGTAAATLTLREPAAGESFEKAAEAVLGENKFEGPARDYWFAYTSSADAEYSFATSGTLKHVNLVAGVELKVDDNVYRLHEGETIYVCVSTAKEGSNTFTISSKGIVAGDYCDNPIYFELGQELSIAGRGIDCFHSFTAEEDGFAIFHSTNWSLHFRSECGGRRLNPTQTVEVEGEGDNEVVKYSYKLPVAAGQSYIVEVESVSEDIVITTGFEGAIAGDVCATAIAIESMDTLNLNYEFGVEKWYKITADKSGYYTIYAKLGYAANMKTKVGDCDAAETNAPSDNSKSNAYMGGYKAAKVYVEEGQVLYIYTKTGEDNGGAEFSEKFYLVPTFAEARPGENVNIAIAAETNKEYEVMTNTDGYEQWYSYIIPAGKEMTATLSATMKFISSSLMFYKDDKTTSMSAYKGDYTQTNVTDDANVIIGKSYYFAPTDADRTIYIKVSTVNPMYAPVVWSIACDDNGLNSDVEAPVVTDEAPVIYDLMGRRVENPGKGIYIINGVKRVIK